MTLDEAVHEAQKWLNYLEAQKAHAARMQEIAKLAKTDPKEAKRQLRQIDETPRLYDGAKLADGLRVLVREVARLRADNERLREAITEANEAMRDGSDLTAWAILVAALAGKEEKT